MGKYVIITSQKSTLHDGTMGKHTTLPKCLSMVSTKRCMNSRIASSFCHKIYTKFSKLKKRVDCFLNITIRDDLLLHCQLQLERTMRHSVYTQFCSSDVQRMSTDVKKVQKSVINKVMMIEIDVKLHDYP